MMTDAINSAMKAGRQFESCSNNFLLFYYFVLFSLFLISSFFETHFKIKTSEKIVRLDLAEIISSIKKMNKTVNQRLLRATSWYEFEPI